MTGIIIKNISNDYTILANNKEYICKPRGKLKAGIDEQINELKEDLPNIDMDNIMITDSGVTEEERKYFYDEVAKLVDPSIIRLTRAGCIVSSHCGPGTIGVLYILK